MCWACVFKSSDKLCYKSAVFPLEKSFSLGRKSIEKPLGKTAWRVQLLLWNQCKLNAFRKQGRHLLQRCLPIFIESVSDVEEGESTLHFPALSCLLSPVCFLPAATLGRRRARRKKPISSEGRGGTRGMRSSLTSPSPQNPMERCCYTTKWKREKKKRGQEGGK